MAVFEPVKGRRARSINVLAVTACVVLAALRVQARPGDVPGIDAQGDELHVIVGPSGRALEPVAIMEPRCPHGNRACSTIDSTMIRDFTVSGFFKVLDRKSFLAHPVSETLASTSWPDWAAIGARYLVKTRVSAGKAGFDIEFRLYDVAKKGAVPVKGQSVSGVRPERVKAAVHGFVNGVIERITGRRGILGSRIVMSLKTGAWTRSIVSMEMDGTGLKTLVANGTSNMFPRWGPGGKVLYTSFKPGHPSLYLDGRRLTRDDREYRGAAFSPNGRFIAASVDMGGQSDIVLLDGKTGRLLRNLTRSPWDEVQPDWSPDGTLVAFMSSRAGTPQIHVIRSDGSGERRLTMAGSYNTAPRFGPDGRIVFCGMDEFVYDIFTVNLEGDLTRLTQDQGSNKDPDWSPDGRYVVFLSNRTGGWRVWIMTEDGRFQFPVSRKAGLFATPDW